VIPCGAVSRRLMFRGGRRSSTPICILAISLSLASRSTKPASPRPCVPAASVRASSSAPTTPKRSVSSIAHLMCTAWSGSIRANRATLKTRHGTWNHPKFLGVKLHPLMDGYLPADPAIHPIMRLLGGPGAFRCSFTAVTPSFRYRGASKNSRWLSPRSRSSWGTWGHSNVVYINASIDNRTTPTERVIWRPPACRCTRRYAKPWSALGPRSSPLRVGRALSTIRMWRCSR